MFDIPYYSILGLECKKHIDITMVQISDQAATIVVETFRSIALPPEKYLRIGIDKGHTSLFTDTHRKNDRLVKKADQVIFIIDKDLDKEMSDKVVDLGWDTNKEQVKLVIRKC